jgi:putative glutathione S-transferase
MEQILVAADYLVGNQLTEADIRAFSTAVRFDCVYVTHFKCNLKTIESSYPSILKWMKRIYQMPGMQQTVNYDHIKKHYFKSHIKINPNQIVGLNNGPDLSR